MKIVTGAKIVINSIINVHTTDWELVDKSIKDEFGAYWSYTSLMQWLTGKKAWKEFESLPEDFEDNGINKDFIKIAITMANDYCANYKNGGKISNGYKVESFKEDYGLSLDEKFALLDNKKLN